MAFVGLNVTSVTPIVNVSGAGGGGGASTGASPSTGFGAGAALGGGEGTTSSDNIPYFSWDENSHQWK